SSFNGSVDLDRMAKTRRILLGRAKANDNFDYKPLFLHTPSSQEEDDYGLQTSNSLASSRLAGDDTSTVSYSATVQYPRTTANSPEQKLGDGPIIFYQGATFCTDLSGDRSGVSYDGAECAQQMHGPIGCAPSTSEDISVDGEDVRGSFGKFQMSHDWIECEDDDTGFRISDFDFQTMQSIDNDLVYDGAAPLELEASGVGGVEPLDNFTINVQVRHFGSSPGQSSREVLRSLRLQSLSAVGRRISGNKPTEPVVRSEIVSATKTNHPPSSLPPPSYFFLPLSSSDSDNDNNTDSDSDGSRYDVSRSLTDIEMPAPQGFMAMSPIGWSEYSSDISDQESDEDPSPEADAEEGRNGNYPQNSDMAELQSS
ncbi:MAG: hypothetical protein M1830_007062, partial [Pleopsidium flavum]